MRSLVVISSVVMLAACSSPPKPSVVDGSNRQVINSPERAEIIALRAQLAQSEAKLRQEQARPVVSQVTVQAVTKDIMLPTWQGHPVKTMAIDSKKTQSSGEHSQSGKEKILLKQDSPAKKTKQLTKVDASRIDSLPVIKKPPEPAKPVIWRAELGSTLKETLFRWSATQTCPSGGNWRVIWETSMNYSIDAPLSFNGDFYAALQGLFGLYQSAQHPLYAALNRAQCLIKVTDKALR